MDRVAKNMGLMPLERFSTPTPARSDRTTARIAAIIDPTFSIIDFPIIDPERVQGTFAILYFFRSAIVFQVKFKCTFFDLTLLEFCVNLLI